MGQSCACILLSIGREEIRLISTSRSLHVRVCVRMLTYEQGISVFITGSGQPGFDSVP